MRLEMGHIYIKDIQFASESKIEDGILYVSEEAVKAVALEDEKIKSASFDIARPGESVRITPVKDVIEPRVKVEGRGGIFPGVISKVDTVGEGKTYALKGMAVVTAGKIVGFQEGIIDMTGPGADYTPFSKTLNLVMVCEPLTISNSMIMRKQFVSQDSELQLTSVSWHAILHQMRQKYMRHAQSKKDLKNIQTFRELLMYRCFRVRDFFTIHMYTALTLRRSFLQF